MVLALAFFPGKAFAAPPLLVDEADVLTQAQERELVKLLEEVSDKYEMDVVIYTVRSLHGTDSLTYAEDIFVYEGDYGYSYGSDQRNGVILLHCPAERDYAVTGTGIIQEHMKPADFDELMDDMIDGMREGADSGDYTDAYKTYINGIDDHMKSPVERFLQIAMGNAILAPIVGFVISFLRMGKEKRKLKSVRRQYSASAYMSKGGCQLTSSRDIFVNRTRTRTPIPKESDSRSSSGGRPASVHTHSSGTSFTGGSRKY